MQFWFRPSLRTLLIAPYLVLVLGTAAIIGALSFRAGSAAVDDLSGQLLKETVFRIGQAVERHVSGSVAVLEAAFPQGVAAPAQLDQSLDELRTRFWLATSVHRDPNNYAYYGDRSGRFFGLWRFSESDAELRLRSDGVAARKIFRFQGIQGALEEPTVEERIYDPRERPWYLAAQASNNATWTSVYIDFKTAELVATRARRVDNEQGQFEGVVATDLSLQRVSAFLKRLALKENGVAFVVEKDGRLIGVSRGEHLRKVGGQNQRIKASESDAPLVAATYAAVSKLVATQAPSQPSTAVFTAPEGNVVQVGYAEIKDDAGLDWLIMVAVPRNDFLQHVQGGFRTAAWLGLLAAAGVALIGMAVLGTVTTELNKLSAAVQRMAQGHLETPLTSDRRDELGALERSFGAMQRRLLTDHLTGLYNRQAFLRRVELRLSHNRRLGDVQPFALVFVDLNHFKKINDRFGHAVGDQVLRELGAKLQAAVRADDMVARYGGDEFVVLLDSVVDSSHAHTVRQHLEAALCQPLTALADLDGGLQVGGACGLALFPDDGLDVQTLLKQADADMYLHKARKTPEA